MRRRRRRTRGKGQQEEENDRRKRRRRRRRRTRTRRRRRRRRRTRRRRRRRRRRRKERMRMTDLPVVQTTVEGAGAPDAGSAVAPVGVEEDGATARSAHPHLLTLVRHAPAPHVLAAVPEHRRHGGALGPGGVGVVVTVQLQGQRLGGWGGGGRGGGGESPGGQR